MSVTFREKTDSRQYDLNARDGSSLWKWTAEVLSESDPEQAIYDNLLANTTAAPYEWKGLLRGRPKVVPLGGRWYDVEIPYVQAFGQQTSDPGAITPSGGEPPHPPPPSPAASDLIGNGVQIDVGGKPPRIFRSLRTISRTSPPNKVAPDFARYINVAPDGKADGVEVPEPAVVLTVTLTFTYLTWGYVDRLFDCCWHTNSAPFAGRAAGQLLLMGANGSVQESGKVPMTFRFGVDKGEAIEYAKTENGAPLTVDRGPWEYAWFAYGSGKDKAAPTAQPVGSELRGVYVEEIFKKTDFRALGIFS